MKLSIVVPFKNAETETPIWAAEERRIAFRREPDRAARCTCAFAAMELQRCLKRALKSAECRFVSQRPRDCDFIELQILDKASKAEGFSLEPVGTGGLVIAGEGRTGVLYGVYEVLRLQGWRWFAPGRGGEIVPDLTDRPRFPMQKKTYAPSMSLGRGFDFEGVSEESADLLIWMARNRLNLSGYRPATGPLGEKLGMSPKIGGHIFESMLNPDRVLPSGKTLWEEHPAWYGLPQDGVRKKEKALQTQFCVSQPELFEFLGVELVRLLTGEWKQAERVDLWGFDTWGSYCICPDCRVLGNGSDQTLRFLSAMRAHLDRARADGRLDHDVRLVVCAYEGTATLDGPAHAAPGNLLKSGDYVAYYPINRCYAHRFDDSQCGDNRHYDQALKSWSQMSAPLPLMVGEYYNVSKFEDLPLLFTQGMAHDIPHYHRIGVRGLTYMHLPMVNWGMRTLTQLLYAQLAWDIQTDVEPFVDEYFRLWYGPHADAMRQVYAWTEEAWKHSAQWRAWKPASILSQLLAWDGAEPAKPLTVDGHFGDPAGMVKQGKQAVALLTKALNLLQKVRKTEREASAKTLTSTDTLKAVNPVQARQLEQQNAYETRLGEDRRLLRYGLDTLRIMSDLAAYHTALHQKNRAKARRLWNEIEVTADSLDSYYIPINFEEPGAGLVSRDALTRSQVREVLRRCRAARLRTGSE